MKRHVFMRGKGRRPDFPEVKTVLLQLLFLKQDMENNGIAYSFRKLRSLLERLVPHTCHVTESKVTYQMTSTLKESLKKRSDRVIEFLTQEYYFLRLPDPLNSLGVTRFHLQNVENYLSPPSSCIPVSVAIALENQCMCTRRINTMDLVSLINISHSCMFSISLVL
ncbi:uncharacterized protein LOC106011758 [Aplysia californica]|uniref:Uncharacterized protein LOC106011758 n=1 Tax=Aplysia californica TaxID=6500 RepID=A0ABM0ZZU2_APLCA|nr:uncharacterized protein LOC106011758 [Aplysia californica]